MYKRILVPLDGSARAERAIPVAARIARALGGSVTLLRVATAPVDTGKYSSTSGYVEETADTDLTGATSYLENIAGSDELTGIKTEVKTFIGAVAPAILSASQSLHANIIVMCSHGYTGFKRWTLGSVADKVTRHSPIPVFVLREDGPLPATAEHQPVRALVAVDGSSLSEAVFEPAAYLAAALAEATSQQGALHLLRVVDLPASGGKFKSDAHIDTLQDEVFVIDGSPLSESALEPAAQLITALAPTEQRVIHLMRVVDVPSSYGKFRSSVDEHYDAGVRAEAKHEYEAYLDAVAKRFTEGDLATYNLSVATSVPINMDVAEAIVEAAEEGEGAELSGYDLIVMATHGRGGVQRWVLGSVAERVLHASKVPLMVVHSFPVKHEHHKESQIEAQHSHAGV